MGTVRWRLAPAARIHFDQVDGEPLRAGARGIETAVGLHAGPTWLWGDFRIGLRLGLLGTHRYIEPDAAVGPIFCAPVAPCGLDDTAPPIARPYHALTAWTEADLSLDLAVSDSFALGIRASFAVNPGFIELDPPPVAPPRAEGDRIRELPALPQYRALVRIGFWWTN